MKDILLLDDHPSVREGTKAMLEKEPTYNVVTADTISKIVSLLKQKKFDIYLIDLYMPEMSGLELTKMILTLYPDAVIIIISGFDIEPHFNLLVENGVSGFICKTATQEQLINAVNCALLGEAVIPISLLKQLRRDVAYISPFGNKEILSLSTKEQDILYHAAKGKSNKEISQELYMSQRMVEYHLTSIFGKLNVKSRVEAVTRARELKLVPIQSIK